MVKKVFGFSWKTGTVLNKPPILVNVSAITWLQQSLKQWLHQWLQQWLQCDVTHSSKYFYVSVLYEMIGEDIYKEARNRNLETYLSVTLNLRSNWHILFPVSLTNFRSNFRSVGTRLDSPSRLFILTLLRSYAALTSCSMQNAFRQKNCKSSLKTVHLRHPGWWT